MVAFSAANTADRSSDGSAWHSEPPIVPQLRTIGSAMTRSASCRMAKCSPARPESSSSACRVSAPIGSSPPATRRNASSARPLMSISVSGWASRSFIIGIRLWPPASSRDSGPYRASSSRACSTLAARSYST